MHTFICFRVFLYSTTNFKIDLFDPYMGTLTDSITLCQSRPGSNGNKGVPLTPQWSRTVVSPSNIVKCRTQDIFFLRRGLQFSFSKTGCHCKVKELVCPTIYPLLEGKLLDAYIHTIYKEIGVAFQFQGDPRGVVANVLAYSYLHIHAHARAHTHTHTHTHMYIYIYIYIWLSTPYSSAWC